MPLGLAARWPLIVSSLAILLSVWLVKVVVFHTAVARFPSVGQGSLSSRRKQFSSGAGRDLYQEGYRLVRLICFLHHE
jgi:hypothetical protein